MKKILFFASIFVAGAATVSVAQFSGAEKNANFYHHTNTALINLQDTTKPVKDTVPPKKDSTAVKF